jgi:hypothetical protein
MHSDAQRVAMRLLATSMDAVILAVKERRLTTIPGMTFVDVTEVQ